MKSLEFLEFFCEKNRNFHDFRESLFTINLQNVKISWRIFTKNQNRENSIIFKVEIFGHQCACPWSKRAF